MKLLTGLKAFIAGVLMMSTAAQAEGYFDASSVEVPEGNYVELTTDNGSIVIELYPDLAPNHVASFKSLIAKDFYNGLLFHRVIPGFVAQGGDPTGTGMGGPGYRVKAEFNDKNHVEGSLAMARSAHPDSAGSQFYLVLDSQPHLDGQYTLFGQVVKGLDIMHKIQQGDKMLELKVLTEMPQ